MVSLVRTSPATDPTNATSLTYQAKFSENVTGVDAADFQLALNGITVANPLAVSGSGSTYTVTISGIQGGGTLGLNLLNDQSIHDLAGTPLAISNPGVSISSTQTFDTGSAPSAVAAGDLNGDGLSDLVVANSFPGSVSLLLGVGNRTFSPATNIPVGTSLSAVAVGDLNEDGFVDLAVANRGDNTLSVLLGNGDGTFVAPQNFATQSAPNSVAMGDFNGDAHPDIVVANRDSNTVSVLLSNGDGTFLAARNFFTADEPYSVAVGDVNGDGHRDLAVANYRGYSTSVLLGNGNGTFAAATNFATPEGPLSVALADLNGDGRLDLATANLFGDSASLLLGNGNGTFAAAKNFATASEPYSISVGDLNGDGRPDLAVVSKGGNSVSVLRGIGDGTFSNAQNFATGGSPISGTLADLDGDGRLDIAVANNADSTVSVLLIGKSQNFVGQTTTDDQLAPQAQIITPSVTTDSATANVTVDYFDDGGAGIDPSTFGVGNISIDHGATITNISVSGNLVKYTFSAPGGDWSHSFQGTYTISLNTSVRDLAGNTVAANPSFATFDVHIADKTTPQVVSIAPTSPVFDPTAATSLTCTVTFSESVTGVDASDFQLALSGVTVANPLAVSGSGSTYAVTISGIQGHGTLGLNLVNNGSIHDLAGNALVLPGTFSSAQNLHVNVRPASLAMADVNGDGRPDLVVASAYTTGPLSVLLGNGDGTFTAGRNIAQFSYATSIALVDLNGDGQQDLLVATRDSTAVSVLLGNGNGTFAASQNVNAGYHQQLPAVGDVNGDGHPDLVAANSSANSLFLFLGNGNGTFAAAKSFAGPRLPNVVVEGDLNQDGRVDLVVGTFASSGVYVLLGNGNGTFAASQNFFTGSAYLFLKPTDFNGDGRPDLAFVNFDYNQNSVSVLLGNGNGTFAQAESFAITGIPLALAAGDVNADGHMDLATVVANSNIISLVLGDGHGGFAAVQNFAVGNQVTGVVAGDVNGDGHSDLAVLNPSGSTISVLLSQPSTSFTGQVATVSSPDAVPPTLVSLTRTSPATDPTNATSLTYTARFSESVIGVDAGDFQLALSGVYVANPLSVSGSGSTYTVTISGVQGSGTLGLNLVNDQTIHDFAGNPLSGSSSGIGFSAPQIAVTGFNTNSLATNDLNGDGRSDLVVTDGLANVVGVLLGNGDGTFASPRNIAAGSNPASVAIGDLNADGFPDLAVANRNSDSLSVLLGNGDGTFAAPRNLATGVSPQSVVITDVNGDHHADLVVADRDEQSVSVLQGNGNGSFAAARNFVTGFSPHSVAAGDLNGDGHIDLAVANYGEGTVSVLLGNGDGTFAQNRSYNAGPGAISVVIADLFGDGHLDLAVANYSGNSVSILRGNGDGTFAAGINFAAGPRPHAVLAADLTGNGQQDLLVIDKGSSSLNVLLGNGNGTFAPSQPFVTGQEPTFGTLADLNGDGDLDLAISGSEDGVVNFLFGNSQVLPGQVTTIDQNPPQAQLNPVNVNLDGSTATIEVNYFESQSNGSGIDPSQFGLGNISVDHGAKVTGFSVDGGSVTYTITSPGSDWRHSFQGTYTIQLTGEVSDRAGNRADPQAWNYPIPATLPRTFVIDSTDRTVPQLVSITRPALATESTNATTLTYVVKFSESVVGVDASEFQLALQGLTVAEPLMVSGSGSTYTVTISGVQGNGPLGLNLVNGASIRDLAGNALVTPGAFSGEQPITAGNRPISLALNDVTGDNHLDLVVTDRATGSVQVLAGNGDGTFAGPKNVGSVHYLQAVAVGDLNGDGRPDLAVVSHSYPNSVSVLLGNGNGTFAAPRSLLPVGDSDTLVIADANSDGRLDLISTDEFSNNLSVLLGNGDGTFATARNLIAGAGPSYVAVVDFNRDGHPDLAVSNYADRTLSVLLGIGNGDFAPARSFATGLGAESLNVADFNGDGRLDLADVNRADNTVSVLLGNGNGTFSKANFLVAGDQPSALVAGDLNGDGHADLAVATTFDGNINVLFGDGHGAFSAPQNFVSGYGSFNLASGDINGDGHIDLVTANYDLGTVSVLLGKPAATVPGQVTVIDQTNPTLVSLVRTYPVVDPTQVGAVTYMAIFSEDVVGVNVGDFQLALHGVTVAQPLAISGSGNVYMLTISGIAGTGTIGVALVSERGIQDLAGNPLLPPATFAAPLTAETGRIPIASAIGDFNHDGQADLVVANLLSQTLSLRLGNGDGRFDVPQSIAIGERPEAIAAGDVNGDGRPDLLVASAQADSIGVLLGNGNGTFAAMRNVATTSLPYSVTTADVNGDGHMDLAVANGGDDSVSILLGNGNGTFRTPQRVFTGTRSDPISVAAGDLNGDRQADLAIVNGADSTVRILPGNGNGTFAAARTFATGKLPLSVSIGDLNGDGQPDLAVANLGSDTVSVLLGQGSGAFTTARNFATGHEPGSVTLGDVNHDGRLDLSVANRNDNTVSILLSNATSSLSGQVTTIDHVSPTATLTAPYQVGAGNGAYTFTITYTDNFAMDVNSVAAAQVVVTGPNNYFQLAKLVRVDDNTNGTPRTATYSIASPIAGGWRLADQGTYTVTLGSPVFDVAGNPFLSDTLGTFGVLFPVAVPSGPTALQVVYTGGLFVLLDEHGDQLDAWSPATPVAIAGNPGVSNTLTFNLDGVRPSTSATIVFVGGAGGVNTINVASGNTTAAVYNSTGAHSGSLVLQNGTGVVQIAYENLTPLFNAATSPSATFNLPTGVSGTLGASPQPGVSQLDSTNGTFEQTTFTNPSAELTLNAGANSFLNITALPGSLNFSTFNATGNGATFQIVPSATTSPEFVAPADSANETLIVDLTHTSSPALKTTSAGSGEWSFADRAPVNFTNFETVVPVVRLFRAYNSTTGQHFFTPSEDEFNTLVKLGLHDESSGQDGFAVATTQVAGAVPLLRLYNPNGGQHYYTLDPAEAAILVAVGWKAEGNAGYLHSTAQAGTVEVFHLYNTSTGEHLFTASTSYRDALESDGTSDWKLQTSLGYGYLVTAADLPAESSSAQSLPAKALEMSDVSAQNLAVQPAGDSTRSLPIAAIGNTTRAIEVGGISPDQQGLPVRTADKPVASGAGNQAAAPSLTSTASTQAGHVLSPLDDFWTALSTDIRAGTSTALDGAE